MIQLQVSEERPVGTLSPRTGIAAAARRAKKVVRPVLLGAFSLLVFGLLWEAASQNKWNFLFRFENVPAPTEVIQSARALFENPKFVPHVWNSIRRIFIGFGIASVLAIGIGLVIGRFRLASELLLPPLEVLRPIPAVAWIPLAILMFYTGEQSMVFITFIGAFFPVLLNTIHGVASLDRRLVHASLTFGAGPVDVLREVLLPGALPSIITGLSIGMGTSWFSLVTAEMISGQFGIGYFTWEAYTLQNYPDIVLGMISIGVLGMGSSLLIKGAGRLLTPWFQAGGRA